MADDLDGAVAEFGEWVEAEIRREVEAESERLGKDLTTAQRRGRLDAKAEEVWWRLIRREVRLKRQTPEGFIGGRFYPSEVFYFVKPYTGDPMKDNDMSDAEVVYVR